MSAPNVRRTEQKTAIRRAISAANRPLTPGEILEMAQQRVPNLGLATVYRNIKTLVDSGWLAAVDLPGEPSRYELAEHDHHHHFRCDACGRVYDVHGCDHVDEAGLPPGFVVRGHEVLLFGLCQECA